MLVLHGFFLWLWFLQFSRDMVVNVYTEYVNNFPMAMEEIKAARISKPGLDEFLNVSGVPDLFHY